MITERTLETYDLHCKRCDRQWQAHYEVVEHYDAGGNVWSYYTRDDGVRTVSPRVSQGPACPSCGGLRVEARLVGQQDAANGEANEVDPVTVQPG